MSSKKSVADLLTRSVDQILPNKEKLRKLIEKRKIRLYLGIDPTSSKLHLGHTIQLRKLQAFADLGHQAILVFGTGTVLVGDPSERITGRKLITEKEVEKNIKTWKDQVRPIINFDMIKVRYNSDWLTKLTLKDLIFIGSKISAVQLFKRDNFQRRIKHGDTVWFHETMYPLLQGYDSVHLDVDLEIGGTDQTFNMLIGRELQGKINKREKFVLTNRMIIGADGKLMSKTAGNFIWLKDRPENMFGKLMKIKDELLPQYFEFLTDKPISEIREMRKEIEREKINPMILKKELALTIVSQFHGKKKAVQAQEEFEQVFQKRQPPKSLPTFPLSQLPENPVVVSVLLTATGLVSSKSKAKRLAGQGGVKLDNKVIIDTQKKLKIKKDFIIQIGKRKFLKFL